MQDQQRPYELSSWGAESGQMGRCRRGWQVSVTPTSASHFFYSGFERGLLDALSVSSCLPAEVVLVPRYLPEV